MISFIRNKSSLLILFIVLGCNLSFAQNSTSYFYENEFDFSLPSKNRWSVEIGIGNRGMLQERLEKERISGYQHEHLEINQFTNYSSKENFVVSLGLRYRFKEFFSSAETDEFRIIEQLEYEPVYELLSLSHRIRLEQRFRENTTYRIRYEIIISTPINENFSIGTGTEGLYAVSSQLKPEAEQRFTVGLEISSFKNIEWGIDLEYRMENYTRDLAHEIFFITGVDIAL